MLSRRDFLTLTSAAAIGGSQSLAQRVLAAAHSARVHDAGAHWPPYEKTLVIDGESGVDLFFAKDNDPSVPKQLAQVRETGVGGILFSVGPSGQFWLNDAAFENTKTFIAKCNAKIAAHSDVFTLVRNIDDLRQAHQQRRVAMIFRFQGSEPLGEDTDRIPMFRKLGVLVIQLTHNRHNLVGDGATERGNAGLSNYGHEVVERLNVDKVVVDLAHGAPRTISEGIAASKAPVLISHAGCRALADLPRNVSDESLRAMADRGGVAGMIFWPYLRRDSQPLAIDVVRHLEHAVNVCGEDHVGIGTDTGLTPIDRTPAFEAENRTQIASMVEAGIFEKGRPADLYTFIPDLNTPDRFDRLAAMLSKRGHSDARIAKILGDNFARVMGEVWG